MVCKATLGDWLDRHGRSCVNESNASHRATTRASTGMLSPAWTCVPPPPRAPASARDDNERSGLTLAEVLDGYLPIVPHRTLRGPRRCCARPPTGFAD